MRRRLLRAGLACNDVLFGLRCSGRLDEATLCDALERLRPGIAEVYLHPATRCGPREQSAGVGPHASEELEADESAGAATAAGAERLGGRFLGHSGRSARAARSRA